MISSTARDLPAHRKEVMDACLRQGMFPMMMEHLPASDSEAISASIKMVDEAEIYVGVFAHRYGYVPKGHDISVTEMEYNRAVERKIPRLIFVMDKAHPITIDDVEQGEGAIKLAAFTDRVKTENIVNFFKSPADLRADVINSLSKLREPDLTTFHYISDIPAPPEAFIAHPYTLLQTHRLVGRQAELNLLTDWVARNEEQIYQARILNIVAIGGLGKSALTWKWFSDIAPQEMKPLAGRMWWSFYESDASFENFVTRALAYVTRRRPDEVQQIPAPDREALLLVALDREPFLIVLDGLERILTAYARMDAARLEDSQVGNQKNLRKTADPRAGRFLKKLAQVKNSRMLVSTRLYPADLETDGGDPMPGTFRLNIEGLTDDDAVEFWRAFKITGSRDELLPVFVTFGKHPLLIQALAGEIKRYKGAPGNFQRWRKDRPHFNPTQFPILQERMAHTLEYALRGLDDKTHQTLRIIAAFRMPAQYDTLAALVIGEGQTCADELELDKVLTELEERGLVGWDKRANRYDMHPIVRGVVWGALNDDVKRNVYTNLHAHFEAMPKVEDLEEVSSVEELAPDIELYNTLIGLGRYDDAEALFSERMEDCFHYHLSATRQRAELVEMLFPDGLDKMPRLSRPSPQARTLNSLAWAYQLGGRPGQAAPLFRRAFSIYKEMNRDEFLAIVSDNLANVLRLLGYLRQSEGAALNTLVIRRKQDDLTQERKTLSEYGLTLAMRGVLKDSASALQRSLRMASNDNDDTYELSYLAERSLCFDEYAIANSLANRAWDSAIRSARYGTSFILAARLQGATSLFLKDFGNADERLHYALARARAVNCVEEELPALVALAELRRSQGDVNAAREYLDDVWEMAELGPYPLIHADASNVLAQIERDAGNPAKAVEAATRAYQLAWCDGPPFAYHQGLERAKKHLEELKAPEPQLSPFDESKFEPMPVVEIDPTDEFHAGKENT